MLLPQWEIEIGELEKEIKQSNERINIELEIVDDEISKCKLQKHTDILHSLDKKRFRKRLIKDLGKSVPIFNLGSSGIEMFQ